MAAMKKQQAFSPLPAYALTLLVGGTPTVQAAPGELAQQPLFLINNVAPNVFFLNDDSGSMDFEVLTTIPDDKSGSDSILLDYSLMDVDEENLPPVEHRDIDGDGTADCNFSNRRLNTDTGHPGYGYVLETSVNSYSDPDDKDVVDPACLVAAEQEWRVRSHRFNHLYFNPERTYEPWPGREDAPYDAAPIDPTDPDSSTIDLSTQSAVLFNDSRSAYYSTQAWADWCGGDDVGRTTDTGTCKGWRYYPMADTDGNGIVEGAEKDPVWLHDLDPSNASDAALLQNFANWFTYHRKREYVAKYAISKIIDETNGVRMGFATINNNSNNRVEIQDADADKSSLISAVLGTASDGSTPLVSALEDAGDYYKDHNFFGDTNAADPVLAAPDGACQINNAILMTDGYYSDGSANKTLASVAAAYYADFRDYPGTQNMNTYTVAFGVQGTLPPDTNVYAEDFTWPDPTSSDAAKIDDLWHAAVEGHGLFLSAGNSNELVEALTSAISDITGQVQSANAVATSAFQLRQDSPIYISRFNPSDWSGELLAYRFNIDGGISDADLIWNAATELEDQDETTRAIITFNGRTGVKFLWDDISPAMQTELTAGDTDTPGIGAARLDYLRGKPSDEFSDFSFRPRNSLLGDIVNASPVYVGAPAGFYPDSDPFGAVNDRYYDFWDRYKNRPPVIYVGANDGMLHGFDAGSGAELFAYVPEAAFPYLHTLTDPAYTHRFFVDSTPSVGDVYLDGNWRTVLVGGLGAGGRGVYALDITEPNRFEEAHAAERVLWEFNEFNSDADGDLGYTFSRPVIALTEDRQEGRWAAIVGNGYNSDSGVASLFIIYLDADLSDGWTLNRDYRVISTGAGSANDKNGLSSPTAVDSDADGYVDRVYAGDLKGNMWAFDLRETGDTWKVAYQEADGTPVPLFNAAVSGEPQPITAKPSVIRHPFQPTLGDTAPNLMILFGTGQYLTRDDLDNTQTQSFYGVWDRGRAVDRNNAPLNRDKLVRQNITTGQEMDLDVRTTTRHQVSYDEGFGWYIDLSPDADSAGERVISSAVVINNTVFFTTYIPNSNPCGQGGRSWFMFVNAADGGTPLEPVISISGDRLINADDLVTLNGETSAPSGLLVEGTLGRPTLDFGDGQNGNNGSALIHTEGGIDKLATNLRERALGRRLSWRELRDD